MATILSKRATSDAPETSHPLSKLASYYKAIVSWMRQAWSGQCILEEPPAVVMNRNMNNMMMMHITQEQEAEVQERLIEEHLRSLWFSRLEQDFSQAEIVSLCRLRDHYQHGGSDRGEVLRRWSFMKYLVEQNLIEL